MGIKSSLVVPGIVASAGTGGGSIKTETLLSITTAPSRTFEAGSKYYNSTTKKIYTATSANTWTDAIESDPEFGTYYTYDEKTYVWDGNTLELFELEEYQKLEDRVNSFTNEDASNNNYPTTLAVKNYVKSQGIARSFEDAGITKTTSQYSTLDLAQEIQAKQFTIGTTLFGEVHVNDMPSPIVNSELRVDILETKANNKQVILFTLYSTNVEPYEWTYIYYLDNAVNWIPSLLPDQTGNSGKFLTTNGTKTSWGNALENTATGTNALTILGTSATGQGSINIGKSSNTLGGSFCIALGNTSIAAGSLSTAIGTNASATGYYSVAIGGQSVFASEQYAIAIGTGMGVDIVKANARHAIQLGQGTNNTANSFQVFNYQMLDGTTGKIPAARLPIPQYTWYTGNTGTSITIADTSNANLVLVYKNGLLLQPPTEDSDSDAIINDYSINGTTLTLASALVTTDKITVAIF